MQITYGAMIPLPMDKAFDFVSNPANWPTFMEALESAEALEGWGAPGGKARMVTRTLGRTVTTDLELVEWSRPDEFRYIGHTAGRPDMDNRRVFGAVPGGTRLTGTTVARGRRGLAAPGDLLALVALRRILHRTMKELPARALEWEHAKT